MTVEKIIKNTLTIAGIALGLFLFPFSLKIFAPFIASFIVASLFQRMIVLLEKRFKISRGISSAIIVTLAVSLITIIISVVIFQLFSQSKTLISSLPDTIGSLKLRFNELADKYNGYKLSLPIEISSVIDSFLNQLAERSTDISVSLTNKALSAAKNVASALPGILLFLTMFILGTFFFTKDYRLIVNFFYEISPSKITQGLSRIKKILAHAFSAYIKAQIILVTITSLIITISFWIVGIKYPLLWGIVCGLVDFLPFLGTATVLVPLAFVSLIYNDFYTFTALLIIQVLVFIVRQLAEPRVVSNQIGVHPILTLISFYIGLKYFGVLGMILAPVTALVLVNIYVSYRENTPN